jgi:hypothetical protein
MGIFTQLCQPNMLIHFQWISSLHTSPPFPDFSNWHPCTSHLKSTVNSLATSKGRRRSFPFHYASTSNIYPHTTSNLLSYTSCSHASRLPFKSNRIYNLHSLVHSSRSFLSSECKGTFCLGTKVAELWNWPFACLVQQRLRMRETTPPLSLTYVYCGAWLSTTYFINLVIK